MQKLQSSVNSIKTQGVILESEVTSVSKAFFDILKDNLEKMGSTDELNKFDKLPQYIGQEDETASAAEPKPPVIIDLTPQKPPTKIVKQEQKGAAEPSGEAKEKTADIDDLMKDKPTQKAETVGLDVADSESKKLEETKPAESKPIEPKPVDEPPKTSQKPAGRFEIKKVTEDPSQKTRKIEETKIEAQSRNEGLNRS